MFIQYLQNIVSCAYFIYGRMRGANSIECIPPSLKVPETYFAVNKI